MDTILKAGELPQKTEKNSTILPETLKNKHRSKPKILNIFTKKLSKEEIRLLGNLQQFHRPTQKNLHKRHRRRLPKASIERISSINTGLKTVSFI